MTEPKNVARVAAGQTTGGQFATATRAEPTVSLAPTSIRPASQPWDDPTWSGGMVFPAGMVELRDQGLDLNDDAHVESAITAVTGSGLSRQSANHAVRPSFRAWDSWARRRSEELAPNDERGQRYAQLSAGMQHGLLALYSNTAEIRGDYVVARYQRESGYAPLAPMVRRVEREMTSKRTSKESRTEWANMVRSTPPGPMRNGMVLAGLVLSGQDGWWGLRERPESLVD